MLSAILKQYQIPVTNIVAKSSEAGAKGYEVTYANGYQGFMNPEGKLISDGWDWLFNEEIVGNKVEGYLRVGGVDPVPVSSSGTSTGGSTTTTNPVTPSGVSTAATGATTNGNVLANPLEFLTGTIIPGVPNWALLVGAVFLLQGKGR